jgi:glycine/D-amino acid oxidase-like deaminating enzyme
MIVASRPENSTRAAARDALVPTLTGGARVDVCIVGAGLAGMIAAYLLARDRRSVMVIDEGPIGGVHAAFEAAHLASVVEKPYTELERAHGTQGARVAAQSHAAAIDAIESIIRRERIACEFERLDGYFFPANACHATAQEEFAAARRAGVEGIELLRVSWGECLRYPGQAQFHPLKFLAGLARSITREGGRIHCGVRIKSIVPGRPATIVTSAGHRIEAAAIVTPNAPRADAGVPPLAPRIAHVIGLRVARGSVPRAVYWEASDPARCVRLRSQGIGAGEVLLVGGEDPAGDEDHTAYRYNALEDWARRRFPHAGEVVQRFTGHAIATPDVFVFASHDESDSQSLYVATGDWGTAMTRGAIAGMLIKEFVEGAATPCADLYLPAASYVRQRIDPAPARAGV